MRNYCQELFEILNDIVYGLKNVKTVGCVELSQIKSAYRAIFGEEYAKNENKEIIASKLNGRMRGLSNFLTERGCCWIDFIGCDSFSNKNKKQIFFATVSRDEEVYENRNLFLSTYSKLVNEKKPVDIFVQLFFVDKDKFIERLNSKSDSNRIANTLEKIQKDGFVIPLSKEHYEKCKEEGSGENPLIVDALGCRLTQTDDKQLETMFYGSDKDFVDAIDDLIERKTKLRLYDQMELLLRKLSKRQDIPELAKIVTIFNKSLLPSEVKLLYFIPTHCPDEAVGLFCYGAKETLSERELKEIKLLSYNILYPYVTSYKSAWENEKIIKESIKSAVSAIMSRNMSHNLGSHYLYYTKNYLETLANISGEKAPDIRGAAKVLGYVQARMDYLATVISNDKYPYGAVNFKSQIYDELTVDDFSHRHFFDDKNKRTTNFLLTNLIYSENFTRPDVRSDEDLKDNGNQLFLHVKLLEENKRFADFTGTWHSSKLQWVRKKKKDNPFLPTMATEEDVKNQLSSLNIALPGGSMSCHALFNVIENFIRNSAKYLQNDINKEKGLICTIALSPNPFDNRYIDVTIFDNKKNANRIVDEKTGKSLYNQILEKLCSLIIIDEQNKISKEDKGFKEMLFSSIWMRAYTYGNNNTYADIISKINTAKIGEEKLSLIERHGFSLVKVVESQQGDIIIYDRNKNIDGECNLGLQLKLPLFKQCDEMAISGNKAKDVDTILNTMSDIVIIDKDFLESEYHHVFTRPLLKDEAFGLSMYERYHKVVSNRFPDIDKYSLSLQKAEDSYNSTPPNYQIFFKRHLSTSGNADPNEYMGYAYADSVSGGNFTITLLDLFNKGYENGAYKTDDDQIFALKIKESALTRVTVIDERLFKSTHENDYPWLSLKNIRVLNYYDSFDDTISLETNNVEYDISKIFIGNTFRDGDDMTHFLTIHLGLIEKILKNSTYVNNLINKRLGVDKDCEHLRPLDSVRVRTFMQLLREHYSNGNTQNLYVAVHSGRGNYSAELEGPLSKYPFISLSALENAFNNSKYQLCQLLYNTVYIGKGFANNIKQS